MNDVNVYRSLTICTSAEKTKQKKAHTVHVFKMMLRFGNHFCRCAMNTAPECINAATEVVNVGMLMNIGITCVRISYYMAASTIYQGKFELTRDCII